jgi:guanylate kinase
MVYESKKHLFVLSSPSGGGKSTVARFLLRNIQNLSFSVSATTRPKRNRELHGRSYYFIGRQEFESMIQKGEFVEYEEIFGEYYGTLHSEIDKAIKHGRSLVFDVDVKGALSLKQAYPEDALLIFLAPPDSITLEERLKKRKTENAEQIQERLKRAEMELSKMKEFDYVVINDVLDTTFDEVKAIVEQYI